MKIALLTLEALASARAVRRFVLADPGRIALIGLSDPFRPSTGGATGQALRHVRRSGPGFLPYLVVNFSISRWVGPLVRRARREAEAQPLAALARGLGVPAARVDDVNGEAFRRRLAESGADILLTFHFDQILSAETLAAVPLGGLNVHPSLLPRHRGPTPTLHALLDAEPAFGVTVHRLSPRIDAGAIVAQAHIALPAGISALGAARALHEAAAPLIETALAAASKGAAPAQQAASAPYQSFPTAIDLKRIKALGRKTVDWRDVGAAFATAM
jgi:folate-dependent phosphoribosylglycinamide formyltransferase PurN